MGQSVKIKNALISVYYKDGLTPLAQYLANQGVTLYSTGGTKQFIKDLGLPVEAIEDLTGYPSILGGRVKTLHPKVFGGILNRRNLADDNTQITAYEIPEIDLVVVDLYPFEETVKLGGSEQEIIEKIDIGGISLIRAAAKNYNDVVILASKDDYGILLKQLQSQNGATTLAQRKSFAKKAFYISADYDTAIFNYFNNQEPLKAAFKYSVGCSHTLRYGENPHQKGTFYGNLDEMFTKRSGKELSYNNLVDVDAAVSLIDEFTEPAFAVLKHTNACGVASRNSIRQACIDALACDPLSAFGSVLIANREIDLATAEEINKLFFEVLIAPNYQEKAFELLKTKKNRVILQRNHTELNGKQFKTLLNGIIEQDKDLAIESPEQMIPVTLAKPTSQQLEDLFFANKIVKHTKSNAIVLAKNNVLLASGIGQTSRIAALKQALEKAASFGFDVKGAAMASDAFFPFPDCVEIAANAGIAAILQPGGSIKDADSVAKADEKGIVMVTTGVRHFKH